MKERPILFSGPMVRAILDGKKTQTRRVIKHSPAYGCTFSINGAHDRLIHWDGKHNFVPVTATSGDYWLFCPHGKPGDRLWVRETFDVVDDPAEQGLTVDYRATNTPRIMDQIPKDRPNARRWKPSIHMPRKYCRLVLKVTGVRVERLQDITVGDARAEGVDKLLGHVVDGFREIWDPLNAKRGYGWDTNPYVWIIEFKKIDGL